MEQASKETMSESAWLLATSDKRTELPKDFYTNLSYLPHKEIAEIEKAYSFSVSAHAGQVRLSGEPYVTHPFQVARTIAELKLDTPTIIAALLHDVLEDTPIRHAQIEKIFGTQVASIVDGVSRIDILDSQQRKMGQAESFQKMLLAMSKDLRVILVKLADRLHNMRTLKYKPLEKRRSIARETLEVYAPIARHLGIDQICRELQALGFAYLYPLRERVLTSALAKKEGKYQKEIKKACKHIQERLDEHEIKHEISGRRKDVYSVFCKMQEKGLSLSQIMDILAIRINTDTVDECYRILGLVHNLYQPKPGYFKDYIAIPKPNGYQSLHTVLFPPYGVPLEVQIRTHEMHGVAEWGIATHRAYKNEGGANLSSKHEYMRAGKWLQSLLDVDRSDTSEAFMEHLKGSLFRREVYVFTPQGKITSLPRGATVLDFAFAVHTDVGLRCVGAKINNRDASLNEKLRNSQTVEIITGSMIHANPQWLNFTVTSKARTAVSQHLKNQQHESAVKLGEALFDQALKAYATSLAELGDTKLAPLLQALGIDSKEELFHDLGLGEQIPALLAQRLMLPSTASSLDTLGLPSALAIKGTESVIVSFAKCCYPIHGDAIIGMMSPGKGLVVHRDGCVNIRRRKKDSPSCILLEWAEQEESKAEYFATLHVMVRHKRGMLATVADQLAKLGSNIENVFVEHKDNGWVAIDFVLLVYGRKHLAQIIRKIRNLAHHLRVNRG
ncbi:MAG: RelA/SpoT family protein [Candidatus Oxydemutatoraceae bacterium WSBS_2016_MAG_OTU14]